MVNTTGTPSDDETVSFLPGEKNWWGSKLWGWTLGSAIFLALMLAAILVGVWLTFSKVNDDDDDVTIIFNQPVHEPDANEWLYWQRDLDGSGSNPFVTGISKDNVDTLVVQCKFLRGSTSPPPTPPTPATGGVSATVTFKNGLAYFTDWQGYITCFNVETCSIVWQVFLEDALEDFYSMAYTSPLGFNATAGFNPIRSRNSPAIGTDPSGNELVTISDLGSYNEDMGVSETHVYAFDRFTGMTRWIRNVSNDRFHIGTLSHSIYKNRVFFGLSSNEVIEAAFVPGYVCCTSVGYFGALDLGTGDYAWPAERIQTISDARLSEGYSGCGVWQSSPAVDEEEGVVYFTTGNTYSRPASVDTCLLTGTPYTCLVSDIWVDAVIKVDAFSGEIFWVNTLQGIDTWNVDCVNPGGKNANGNCPFASAFPDYDVAGNVILLNHEEDGEVEPALFAMQKSNVAWLLRRSDGSKIWNSLPVGYIGGLLSSWGYAYDGDNYIFVSQPNFNLRSWTDSHGNRRCDGAWSAIRLDNGHTEWTLPVPGSRSGTGECPSEIYRDQAIAHIDIDVGQDNSLPIIPGGPDNYLVPSNPLPNPGDQGWFANGPSRYANGIVYVGSSDSNWYFLKSYTGEVLHTYSCGPNTGVYGGASIDQGENGNDARVFLPCGYEQADPYQSENGALVVLQLPTTP